MPDHDTLLDEDVLLDLPWNVVVHDDPVNLMDYVTWVFMKVLSLSRSVAERHMMEVHLQGQSIVWSGGREKAELFTQQLQAHQLKTSMEKADA
jgi:ATP-dependent Clp protease adaptor protein ClpS